jgi:RNA polymerase sigma factor (sigma-70 family)
MIDQKLLSFPLLSVEDEKEALQKIKSRGIAKKRAKESLVKANLRLVTKISHEYKNLGLDLEDLVNEGTIGLMRAIEKFDEKKNVKFSYYASMWIRQAISRALSNKGKVIRIPHGLVNERSRVNREFKRLSDELGREPDYSELSEATRLPLKKIKKIMEFLPSTISINYSVKEGEEDCRLESILPDNSVKDASTHLIDLENLKNLNKLLKTCLSDREHYIIERRFGLNRDKKDTLETIGNKLGLTRERIRQIEKEAVSKLKKKFDKIEGKP